MFVQSRYYQTVSTDWIVAVLQNGGVTVSEVLAKPLHGEYATYQVAFIPRYGNRHMVVIRFPDNDLLTVGEWFSDHPVTDWEATDVVMAVVPGSARHTMQAEVVRR